MVQRKMSTRKMAIAGMLGAFSVALSATPLGYIPIPFLAGVNATTMHIPVIIGAMTAGPAVGTFIGLIFGVSSLLRATNPFFMDPLVAILPRLLIGIASYGAYKTFKNSVAGAIVGTATNTIGVLGMIYLRGYLPLKVVLGIAAMNGVAEIVVSCIIVYAVMKLFDSVLKR